MIVLESVDVDDVDDVWVSLVSVFAGSAVDEELDVDVDVVSEIRELEGSSFSVIATELVMREDEENDEEVLVITVSELVLGATVTCAVDEGTMTVTTPALPPVADRVSLAAVE